jgi:hypothetical protein
LSVFEVSNSGVKQNKNKKTGKLHYFAKSRTLSRRKSAVDIKEKEQITGEREKGKQEGEDEIKMKQIRKVVGK